MKNRSCLGMVGCIIPIIIIFFGLSDCMRVDSEVELMPVFLIILAFTVLLVILGKVTSEDDTTVNDIKEKGHDEPELPPAHEDKKTNYSADMIHSDERNQQFVKPFLSAKKSAIALFRFLKKLDRDPGVKHILANAVHMRDTSSSGSNLSIDTRDNRYFKTLNNRISLLSLTDVVKCYEHICKTDKLIYGPESLPFGILTCVMAHGDTYIWDNVKYLSDVQFEIAQGYFDIIKQNFTASGIDDKFCLLEILYTHQVDEKITSQYASKLYGFALATALGKMSIEDRIWFASLVPFPPKSIGIHLSRNKKDDKSNNVIVGETSTALADLSALIGLDSVKADIENIYNLIKIQKLRQEKGLKPTNISYHCVLTGNPGTGKTTVARLVAQIYKDLGILVKGHLIETDRAGLVAEYVGQTAVKTNKIIDSAIDGVLFIDEAYSLANGNGNDYGAEAIATLLKRMEDDRDRLVVILAGYSNEMKKFIDSNPGLQSRFNRFIHFNDYSVDQLALIFQSNLKKYDYHLMNDAKAKLIDVLTKAVAHKDKNFGNARYVRNLFEKTVQNQAKRLSSIQDHTVSDLTEIAAADIPD